MSKPIAILSNLLVVCCVALCLVNCSPTAPPLDKSKKYFDLTNFCNQQIDLLDIKKPIFNKMAYLNGKSELKATVMAKQALQNELKPFIDAEINKPAYLGLYTIDTIKTSDTTTCVTYNTSDKKPRTKNLKVYFNNSNITPVKVVAELISDKLFYQSHQLLSYTVNKGYDITGGQTIVLFGKDTFAIKVVFEQKP